MFISDLTEIAFRKYDALDYKISECESQELDLVTKYDALLQDVFKYKYFEIDNMSEEQYLTEIRKLMYISKLKKSE